MEQPTQIPERDQFAALQPLLTRSESDPRQIVVMICGISGSGKSTLAKSIIAGHPSYQRLSIDELIAQRHGLWGVDYDAGRYGEFQGQADEELQSMLLALLKDGQRDIVLDRSFWARETRDEFRKLIEPYGARVILVYLQPPSREFIRQRIDKRREQGRNANSALDIDDDLLERFWDGFEVPKGEGEIVIKVK